MTHANQLAYPLPAVGIPSAICVFKFVVGIMSALWTNSPYFSWYQQCCQCLTMSSAPLATMSNFCRYCNYCSVCGYLCNPMVPNVCAPCQHLSILEGKIKEMRTALVGLERERQRMKEQVNHSHGRLIHRFPPEIAAYIFELSIPEDVMDIDFKHRPLRYTMSAPFILSAVCRRWRAIAQSTPRLWKSLPLFISDDPYFCPAMPVSLVNQWIDRAGELPLSININVPYAAPQSATEIMNALLQRANRVLRLKYEGIPSFVPYFSEDLPQLRTLHLATDRDDQTVVDEKIFKPRPTQLNTLSISANLLVAVDFDWQHLTQLVLTEYLSLTECFEALRKAPCLTRCTFDSCHKRYTVLAAPSPTQNRILQPSLQYLKIADSSDACDQLLSQLVCPNLSTLVLDGPTSHWQPFDIPTIIALLERSKCSLERLSLLRATITAADIAALCEGIPTVQHLHIDALDSGRASARSPSKALFTRLAKHTIIDRMKELQYLPALRSLTWGQSVNDSWSWKALLDIFGPATSRMRMRSTNLRRQRLESVKISFTSYQSYDDSPQVDIDEETLKKILWLGGAVGVKWDLRFKKIVTGPLKHTTEKDLLQRAVDRHLLQSS